MKSKNEIAVDINKVPKGKMDTLCNQVMLSIKEFYADPENCLKFEKWIEQYKQKQTS